MIHPIDAGEFSELRNSFPVIDVRSPGEFAQGHIPRATNLPLFDDEERHNIGILYKKSGRQAAVLEGLGYVGKKLQDLVKAARRIAPKNIVLIHCWRGGMRSESMAWLLSTAGFKVYLLQGGYKSYRRFIRESWERDCELLVLSGKTGTGKTHIIHRLAEKGQQILDLEGCANHKGSAFGAMGERPQPTNEQFENNLADLWYTLDPQKPIWIEDESRFIGKLNVPEALYQKKQQAITLCIDIPKEERIKHLAKEYASFPVPMLIDAVHKISRRLGGQHEKAAVTALEENNFEAAIDIVLNYYDKTYAFDLELKQTVTYIQCSSADAEDNAQQILTHCIKNNLI